MSAQEQLKKVPLEDYLLAPFLVLLVGELTGWNQSAPGGDSVYLTVEQAEALAAEGIGLLAAYLPKDASEKVTTAVAHLPRVKHGSREQRLLTIGRLGGVVPTPKSGPPGCCVYFNGALHCVR
jgi:hypothetical protein